MKLDFTFIKKRPLLTGAIVLIGAFALFLALKGRGGSGSVVVTQGGPDPAQVQAGLQAQAMQFQANQQVAAQNFQLAQQQMAINGQLSIAGLQAQLEDKRSERDTATAQHLADLQAQVQVTGINAQVAQTQIGANVQQQIAAFGAQVQMAGIQAQERIGLATVQVQQTSADAAAYFQRAQADNIMGLATLQAQTEQLGIQRNAEVAMNTNWSQVAIADKMAILGTNQANAQAAAQMAAAKASKPGTNWGGILTGVASIAGLFFSDARMKTDVKLVAKRTDGTGVYDYRFVGSNIVRRGALAQEQAIVRPWAVQQDKGSGFLKVDYSQIARRERPVKSLLWLPAPSRAVA